MKIDWFDFWLFFSGILLFFLFIGLIIRFFQWLKFRQELAYIKEQNVQNIVKYSKNKGNNSEETSREISKFKEEMDYLMKDVCFDLYDRNTLGEKDSQQFSFDFEESLEKLLDGKILNLIKEKDSLLLQKDAVIVSLEEKNKRILKEVVNKMFFLLMEKDKVLREKDSLIVHLKTKIQKNTLVDLDKQLSNLLETVHASLENKEELMQQKKLSTNHIEQKKPVQKQSHDHTDFLNVNFVDQK